jgi:hypothetical protein
LDAVDSSINSKTSILLEQPQVDAFESSRLPVPPSLSGSTPIPTIVNKYSQNRKLVGLMMQQLDHAHVVSIPG